MNSNIYNPFNNNLQNTMMNNNYQQQLEQYNRIYNKMQTSMNSFNGVYVNSYDDVVNAQVNMNGTPTLFIGNNGVMWSKKFVNGQPYISAYHFEAIANYGEPNKEPNTNSQEKQENVSNVLNDIKNTLSNFNERLNKLEGKGSEQQ